LGPNEEVGVLGTSAAAAAPLKSPTKKTSPPLLTIDKIRWYVWYKPGPGIELAGEALNKNAVAVMPKNQWGVGSTQ